MKYYNSANTVYDGEQKWKDGWFRYNQPRTFLNGWTIQKLEWDDSIGIIYRVSAPRNKSNLSTTKLTYQASLAYIRKCEGESKSKKICSRQNTFTPEEWK